MREKVPYVNMQTVKDENGKIKEFIVRTVSYLPKDSKPVGSGEGDIADNILYRPLTISYSGTSTEFDYFGVDFTIQREEIGLLERGVNVKVKFNGVNEKSASLAMSSEDIKIKGDEGGEEGTSIQYEDPDMP